MPPLGLATSISTNRGPSIFGLGGASGGKPVLNFEGWEPAYKYGYQWRGGKRNGWEERLVEKIPKSRHIWGIPHFGGFPGEKFFGNFKGLRGYRKKFPLGV